jgi:hypothetical protein
VHPVVESARRGLPEGARKQSPPAPEVLGEELLLGLPAELDVLRLPARSLAITCTLVTRLLVSGPRTTQDHRRLRDTTRAFTTVVRHQAGHLGAASYRLDTASLILAAGRCRGNRASFPLIHSSEKRIQIQCSAGRRCRQASSIQGGAAKTSRGDCSWRRRTGATTRRAGGAPPASTSD